MPSIAIIGAGPAGLTLARILLVNAREHNITNLDLTIFETDVSAKARLAQGGSLDLHPDTGIAALRAGRMWEEILPHMRYDDQEYYFADSNATTILHFVASSNSGIPGDQDRPEIDREILKDYLLQAVEDLGGKDLINWGKHITEADEKTGLLKFRDGTVAGPFDLVVGADGAWSKIRNIVTNVKPQYSGICGFEAWVDREHAGQEWDALNKFAGKGNYFAYSHGQAIMSQRMEDRSIKIAVWTGKDSAWPADLIKDCGGDENKVREALLTEFSTWDDQLKRLVRASWHYRQWPLYELPVGNRWEHREGWTLIGDAAHLITPFAGEGVNAAMKDALELASLITKSLKDDSGLDEAINEFETQMFPRILKVQKETARNKQGMFRSDAPVGFLADVGIMLAEEMGYDPENGWVTWLLPISRVVAYRFFWSIAQIGRIRRFMRGT